MAEDIPEAIVNYQQFIYEEFGDRDWNLYKPNQHHSLKANIGFSIFGPPTVQVSENMDTFPALDNNTDDIFKYTKKQNEQIDNIYKIILKNNFEKYSDILIRFIIISCQLKNKRKTVTEEPVYVIKKCRDTNGCSQLNNCRIIIDSNGRVYNSWDLYLENNKLPKCIMVFPKDAVYNGQIIGENETSVILDRRESPACSIGNKILNTVDTAGTVVSVGATATCVAAIIPGIAVAPVLLTGAAIGGLGVGLYSAGRSIHTLVDRKIHKQSIGLDNSESRWCWLNTSVGVVGAGASAASGLLTRAVAKGRDINEGMKLAFNILNTANVVGSGTSIVLSGYNIAEKMYNKEKISSLEVLQFASSVLFFHNSVVGFRTANVIISETQATTLSNYSDTLRSNRHRKLFRKAQLEARRLHGETAGNAEIISGIQNINDRNNFFAGLARVNKDVNKNGARYTITANGQVEINSNYIVDPMDFASIGPNNRGTILKNLPPRQITSVQTTSTITNTTFNQNQTFFKNLFKGLVANAPVSSKMLLDLSNNTVDLAQIGNVLANYAEDITGMILKVFIKFLDEIQDSLEDFKQLYPFVSFPIGAIQFLKEYIEKCAPAARMSVNVYVRTYFDGEVIDLSRIRDLAGDFNSWLQNQNGNAIGQIPTKQIHKCIDCIGHYYLIAN